MCFLFVNKNAMSIKAKVCGISIFCRFLNKMSKYLKLSNGFKIPTVGLGTWQLKGTEAVEVIRVAIEAGYRHFDCAHLYGNEAAIGAALRHVLDDLKLVHRDDLFITSKLWCNNHRKEEAKKALKNTLKNLQLDYLDLYLIHFPISFKAGDDLFPTDREGKLIYDDVEPMETWKAMEECVDEGLVRTIGLSNFNISQIREIKEKARIKPPILQVEVYPYFQNQKLIDFCFENDIVVTGYSSLGSNDRTWDKGAKESVLDDDTLNTLAARHGKTPAQIILRWLVQRDIVVIPKSSRPERIRENIDIFDFDLTKDDFDQIARLEKGNRNFGKKMILNGHLLYQKDGIPHISIGGE